MTDLGEFDPAASRRAIPPCHDLQEWAEPDVFLRPDLDDRQARLACVILDDIVPRLQLMHHALSAHDAENAFERDEIETFGALLTGDDGEGASNFFDRMRDKGHSLETLFIGLLAEAARHLGTLWEEDRCDFVDVTLGVARLQKLMCRFGGVDEPPARDPRQRALLATLPGEKHVFGVDMVAAFMRNAAWDVRLERDLEADNVASVSADEWFGVFGITLSAESDLERLARTIQAVRESSANAELGVMVGGPLFKRNPNLVAQIGADATAPDAATATILAKKLVLRQFCAPGRATTAERRL
ncbi:MAG: cobalamin B12-binding domain-containing protein [Methylocystis sp.]